MLLFGMDGVPERAGIMLLPGAPLLPHHLLPLRIFEPRYRAMLAAALESHRMFVIGTPDPEAPRNRARPLPIGALGLIRACVENEDGTSNLILQGVARVRFTKVVRCGLYLEGRLELVVSAGTLSAEDQAMVRQMMEEVLAMAEEGITLPGGLEEYLREIRDPEMLADVMGGVFLRDGKWRQSLLETAEIRPRLEKLAKALQAEYPNLKRL
ncbi:MAG: hypothetical protein OHK005_01030 [Candidatus Methylacidiphilales bacterium]